MGETRQYFSTLNILPLSFLNLEKNCEEFVRTYVKHQFFTVFTSTEVLFKIGDHMNNLAKALVCMKSLMRENAIADAGSDVHDPIAKMMLLSQLSELQ